MIYAESESRRRQLAGPQPRIPRGAKGFEALSDEARRNLQAVFRIARCAAPPEAADESDSDDLSEGPLELGLSCRGGRRWSGRLRPESPRD